MDGDLAWVGANQMSVYTFLGWVVIVVMMAFIGGLALIGLAYCMGLL